MGRLSGGGAIFTAQDMTGGLGWGGEGETGSRTGTCAQSPERHGNT